MSIADRPAFPYVFTAPDPGEGFDEPDGVFVHEGITYREYVAAKIMAAQCAGHPQAMMLADTDLQHLSGWSVAAADALIDALDEEEGESDG